MYKDINKDNQYFGQTDLLQGNILQGYYPEAGLFDGPKYWLSLFMSLYIFGFLFVV